MQVREQKGVQPLHEPIWSWVRVRILAAAVLSLDQNVIAPGE